MISFKIDKQLQTISNYFLFSLAVADITIGKFEKKFWENCNFYSHNFFF